MKYTFPLVVLAFLVTKIKYLTENLEEKCSFWISFSETQSIMMGNAWQGDRPLSIVTRR